MVKVPLGPPIKNHEGFLCGLCDSTSSHEHPTYLCGCGETGLAENWDARKHSGCNGPPPWRKDRSDVEVAMEGLARECGRTIALFFPGATGAKLARAAALALLDGADVDDLGGCPLCQR